MIDDPAAKNALFSIARTPNGFRRASVPFRNGYGGIHRPIGEEIPVPMRVLISKVEIVRIETSFNDPRREVWGYCLTNKGAVLVKLYGAEE